MSLVVVRAAGLITVQDLGRPGRMREALPPGGALVRERLVAANRAAGNADGAAALEVMGVLAVRATADVVAAGDALAPRLVRAGEVLELASEPRRVAYLALRGGVAAPVVLGGRGAQLSAGIGALVRTGDRIEVAAGAPPPHSVGPAAAVPREGAAIRVIPGPDPEAFEPGALAALAAATYHVSPSSDRVGTRLVGPAIARRAGYVERTRPLVAGAIEVPRDGAPIVLGPEHPTTGGYPVLAVVAHDDLGQLFSIRIGGAVRFAIAG